jgi:uncharacterized repeat protein (TIGR01451 family)
MTIKTLHRRTRPLLLLPFLVPLFFVPFLLPSSALAATGSPWWQITSGSEPATLQPGQVGRLVVTAANRGDANTSGEVTIVDKLPKGLKVIGVSGEGAGQGIGSANGLSCSSSSVEARCSSTEVLAPYQNMVVLISVEARKSAVASEQRNEASVSGGGALGASVSRRLALGDSPSGFGIEAYEMNLEEEGGAPATQAGSHPFQLTTTTALNEGVEPEKPPALVKDLNFNTPPGLVGNPTPFPQCTDQQFLVDENGVNDCPAKTVLGVAVIKLTLNIINEPNHISRFTVPLFNLVPEAGEPARFGFEIEGTPVYLDTSVRTGEGYGVVVKVSNISQLPNFIESQVTFWGVPGASSHDNARGWSCIDDEHYVHHEPSRPPCGALEQENPPPFLEMPTSCTGPLQTSLETDSWQQPGLFETTAATAPLPALDGCNELPFGPSIGVVPDEQTASTPTGLAVHIDVPQEVDLDTEGLSSSDVKDTTVTLPAGLALNPSSSDGLQACPLLTGKEKEVQEEKGEISGINLETKQPANCPEASKVATVEIHSPLLPNPLKGFVYLAEQEQNPFGSVFAMYLVAYDPVSGSLVKLAGKIEPNLATGQLVSTFQNTPQLPFDELELHFFGGERAPLATPSRCGTYTTSTSIAPWSENQAAEPSSSFAIDEGPNHGSCIYPGQVLPFDPSSAGGALNLQAGAFSPFTTTLSRASGEQNLASAEVKLPPGLSGLLSGVELCREPQANLGTCAPNSQIGETTVSVGVGGEPYTVTGGKVYITGPYNGSRECTVGEPGCAPFGLAVATPAKAGPYDLADTKNNHPPCDCVLVRAKIEVNPITAALTVTSNPPGGGAGSDSIPTMIEGIPLQIQHVNITTTRSGFQFNPTSCNKMAVQATLHSAEGGTSNISIPFQVTNCASLAFKPGFKVSTSGKTSRATGASLSVKLTYPKAPFGSQANIKSVKVDLPKQLPSRLTTLQKACPAKTFEANPAGCSATSIVGHATAITPLIPVPLAGPAYFVSYGGAKFPELVIALQGYGVTIDLHGETFINKAGITSSTFHTVPDAPVGSFELTLPEGKYSALAANGNLCKSALVMPTAFVAQNGDEIHQNTPIAVAGCAKAKTLTRTRKLAAALRACEKKAKGEQAACEAVARKRYDRKKTSR